MLFNSIEFFVFLPVVFILYWSLPHKYRWVLVLASSYYFYMCWNAKCIVWILLTTIVSYVAARWLEKEKSHRKQRVIVGASVFVCLGMLFYFKYFNFFSSSVISLLKYFGFSSTPIILDVILPVGISFYTFQTLGYVIDVYRGDVKAEHHFGMYAAFISFFPQLVAGPIERTTNLLPQIKYERKFKYDQAIYGLKLMLWGYLKKVVIADTISPYVDLVFANPFSYRGFDFIIAIFFFSIQIYCDFSGYSDIAIGVAKLLGVNLMTNFRSPYFSASIKEFWSRWHISLSTWFRDYLYIPMGGNRCSSLRCNFNLLITFLVSGLWHGANWTFVFWGVMHGTCQIIEKCFSRRLKANRGGRYFLFFWYFAFVI